MILILGVTASGKGRLAFDLAESVGGLRLSSAERPEIISIDSMKVYRRMDIGTAKPPKQARQSIKHHLIDVVEPSEPFSVAAFLELADKAIEQIKTRNKPIIAVGGTALYIKALLSGLFKGPGTDEQIRAELKAQAKTEGLRNLYDRLAGIDPVAAQRISSNDAKRIIRALEVYRITGQPISSFQKQWEQNGRQMTKDRRRKRHEWTIIGLRREKTEENKRINARVKRMFERGLVDEVKSLLAEEKPLSPQAGCAIGYAEVIDYLNGRCDIEEAIELIKKNTRRFAKSQRTWFKNFPNVHWLDIEHEEPPEKILDRAKALIAKSFESP
jgi:tRNA dimethylallyltransferase